MKQADSETFCIVGVQCVVTNSPGMSCGRPDRARWVSVICKHSAYGVDVAGMTIAGRRVKSQ